MICSLEIENQSHSNETKKYQIKIQTIRKEYDLINQNAFVPHQFETYKRRLEHRVQSLMANRHKREETLDRLALEMERN